jgi:hypothetical protein
MFDWQRKRADNAARLARMNRAMGGPEERMRAMYGNDTSYQDFQQGFADYMDTIKKGPNFGGAGPDDIKVMKIANTYVPYKILPCPRCGSILHYSKSDLYCQKNWADTSRLRERGIGDIQAYKFGYKLAEAACKYHGKD